MKTTYTYTDAYHEAKIFTFYSFYKVCRESDEQPFLKTCWSCCIYFTLSTTLALNLANKLIMTCLELET